MLPKAAACSLVLTCALINALAPASAEAAELSHSPKSIASTSLCGDAYLLSLAPERVSALSWQSRDALSRAPDSLQTLPQAWDDTERLLSLVSSEGADYILFGTGEGSQSQKYLSKTDTKFSNLVWGETFESVYANIENLGEAIDAQDQARRLVVSIKDRLVKLETNPNLEKPKILYLSRSGGSAGPGTLVDAAIMAAGGQNILTKIGWFTPDTEFLISLKPDLIITSYFDDGYESVNAAPLRNKTVQKFMSRYKRLDIPGHVWPCAGPYLVEAAEMIHDKIQQVKQ